MEKVKVENWESFENAVVFWNPCVKNDPTKRGLQQETKRTAVELDNKGLYSNPVTCFLVNEKCCVLRGTRVVSDFVKEQLPTLLSACSSPRS